MPLCQVEIPKELHHKARRIALDEGISLRVAIVRALDHWVMATAIKRTLDARDGKAAANLPSSK